jgi:hypothetical protein
LGCLPRPKIKDAGKNVKTEVRSYHEQLSGGRLAASSEEGGMELVQYLQADKIHCLFLFFFSAHCFPSDARRLISAISSVMPPLNAFSLA